MAINSLAASTAYQNQMKMMNDASDSSDADPSGDASNSSPFIDMVENALKGAADTQYKSDATHMQSLTGGKVELSDLVTAVSNAELSLNTVVAVRDRVINAYNDIIKMTI